MQTILTFVAASFVILPILLKIILGNIDFINKTFLWIYIFIFTLMFVILTIYNVITFIQKKAPPSIRYLSLLSILSLIGFLPGYGSSYYGFLGFLGFLGFMSYQGK